MTWSSFEVTVSLIQNVLSLGGKGRITSLETSSYLRSDSVTGYLQ